MRVRDILDTLNNIQLKYTEVEKIIATYNISQIQTLCNQLYSNQGFFGNAALNRKILLDENISKLLTPPVIQFLFCQNTINPPLINRGDNQIRLRDAIYYGFEYGIYIISCMPNNDIDYTLDDNETQKDAIENVKNICKNILIAAKKFSLNFNTAIQEIIEKEKNDIYKDSIESRFERVKSLISTLKENKKSEELLFVPNYSTNDIREQSIDGFEETMRLIRVETKKNSLDLQSFVMALINNPEILMNGVVSHLFWDRVHLQATLEQDFDVTL
ncbi:MAG: hypothetical protein JO131_03380, partial [Gammaproteobacteria bacterium]|nr:hypothetical protein [Gammaproteobacteria bacterium]